MFQECMGMGAMGATFTFVELSLGQLRNKCVNLNVATFWMASLMGTKAGYSSRSSKPIPGRLVG
jgi:hypothetical protein